MNEQFHPTADWPGTLPDLSGTVKLRTVREDALRRVVGDFPVAARLYSIRQAIESAPMDRLLKEVMPCVLAVDCWKERLVCPRNGCRGRTWAKYFGLRADAVRQALSDGLTRAIVLERIPVRWIPTEHSSAQLSAVAARAGFKIARVEVQLIPPIPGGHEWVALDCGAAVATLPARVQEGPVAAILHWPNRTAVAAVVAGNNEGRLKAFGVAFEANGTVLDVAKLSGVTLIQPMAPPFSLLHRWTRALRMQLFVWHWVRQRRRSFGADPLASV